MSTLRAAPYAQLMLWHAHYTKRERQAHENRRPELAADLRHVIAAIDEEIERRGKREANGKDP